MRRLLRQSPNAATAQFILRQLETEAPQLFACGFKLAFLRSFTLEPMVPLLRAAAALYGIRLTVYMSDFNAYSQEILDPNSRLYEFDPDAAVLAVQTRDLVPDLWDRFAELSPNERTVAAQDAQETLTSLMKSFRARHRAHFIVQNLEAPIAPSYGLLDAQSETSEAETIREINRGLLNAARQVPGVYLLDYDSLVARHGRLRWHDERKWLSARMPIASECLVHLSQEYLRFLLPLTGRTCKALVVDLDNTLWGGVAGEDGLQGIQLGPDHPGAAFVALQHAILDLYHRGTILAICSKNNPADAMEVLEKHPYMVLRPSHFAAMRLDWGDKAQNLRAIAADLNIGTDALAFLDDNPVERERIAAELPEVFVLDLPQDPMDFSTAVRESPAFERLSLSEEDRKRPRYYAEERLRKDLVGQTGSLQDFYRSLRMEVAIAPVGLESIPRVAQLTQKTNQFNLTTRRYTEQSLAELAVHPEWRLYQLRASDKFGDSGIVGVAMTRRTDECVEIDSFLLSCRVIGRAIETALLAHLAQEAAQQGARRLRGWFLPTRKNAPAKEFYPSHGFRPIATQPDGETLWEIDLCNGAIECPEWIRCSISSPCLPNL